jgi:hypothetical protein
VPIEATSLGAALEIFRGHLNDLLHRSITKASLQKLGVAGTGFMELTFRQGGRARTAPLRTEFGRIELYLGQICSASQIRSGLYRLETSKYKYTITPDGQDEPLIRWEYVKKYADPTHRWCRHHVQGEIDLNLGGQVVRLNDLHVPTGYVTIEEVIRFCIVDLGAQPMSDQWHEVLEDSYQRFKEEFAP